MNNPKPDTILIVDDLPTNLGLLFRHLERAGFRVMAAQDGPAALSQVQQDPPDLILLDIMLPGVNGFEICRRLKADQTTRDIPIIFMTALSDINSKVRGFEAGGADYVTKPLEFQEVLARVSTHLTNRKLQQALQEKIEQLEHALSHVKTLRGLLPICASCKKIRDDDGYWQQVEVYIRDHSDAEFSHGICPDCFKVLYPEFVMDEIMGQDNQQNKI